MRHYFNAEVSKKDLYETYLPAFKACVQEGKVEAVMGAYNRTNGEPCCGSKTLLKDILRDEWGFEGHVTSDCWAIKDFYEGHNVTKNAEESVSISLPVKQKARLSTSTIDVMPESITVGSETNVMFGINNTGKVLLYNVTATFEGDSIQKTDAYVGNIEPGKTGNVDTMITGASPTMDDGKIKIIISYEDENGAVTEVEKEMSLLVTEPVEETADMGTMDGMDEMMMEEEGVVENSERYRLCVNALKGFMDDAGFSDVVIGLSGGMDSSLVAVMCADALGADRVHGVLMPGPYSTDHSVDDALDLARNLGIRTRTVSIAEPYRAFEAALAEACGGKLSGLAAENTQARCRMVCLMRCRTHTAGCW